MGETKHHAGGSVLDRMYAPLTTKVIWMLPHSSRCYLVAVDRQRCSWACESGALRPVFLYDSKQSLQLKIDWYKQNGLVHNTLKFADDFDEPVSQLPLTIMHITFVSSSISQLSICQHLLRRSHLVTNSIS